MAESAREGWTAWAEHVGALVSLWRESLERLITVTGERYQTQEALHRRVDPCSAARRVRPRRKVPRSARAAQLLLTL